MNMLDARGLSCPEPVIMIRKAMMSKESFYEMIVDNPTSKENVMRYAEHQGYTVIEACDGTEAVHKAREISDIDLCVMDIMMPNSSGVEATAEIRKFSDVPVLFLTAKSLDGDKLIAYDAGGDDYIVKPFSPNELLMKVNALARRYNR